MLLPVSVNGLQLGILILGMTSCGPLPLSIRLESSWADISPVMLTCPLPSSSSNDPTSEPLRELELLNAEAGPDTPKRIGVIGCDKEGKPWLTGVPADLCEGVVGRESRSGAAWPAGTDLGLPSRDDMKTSPGSTG